MIVFVYLSVNRGIGASTSVISFSESVSLSSSTPGMPALMHNQLPVIQDFAGKAVACLLADADFFIISVSHRRNQSLNVVWVLQFERRFSILEFSSGRNAF